MWVESRFSRAVAVSADRKANVIRAGFMPLVDCASLVVAAQKGFAQEEGIDLQLSREVSWANIRDKVNLGHLDCAQMLAGMPIAASLGIGQARVPTIAPMSLGLNGNAITVSSELGAHMRALAGNASWTPQIAGRALKQIIVKRQIADQEPLTFGMVYPFSNHNYELRYWMAACDIDPDKDVRLVVIPPPLMVESLQAGHLDGFCVGEPWNSLAVEAGLGDIVATGYQIWNNSPEKVLGVPLEFAEANPAKLSALIRALFKAAVWLDQPENAAEAAGLLSDPAFLGIDDRVLLRAMSGKIRTAPLAPLTEERDFLIFHRNAATFPWKSHALWVYSQMVRWGQIALSPAATKQASEVYRPDVYRDALAQMSINVPTTDVKPEGTHKGEWLMAAEPLPLYLGADSFFDGTTFDPEDSDSIGKQLDSFAISHHRFSERLFADA